MPCRREFGEVRGHGRREDGQATVEYLLLVLAFVSMLAGMAAVWYLAQDGHLGDLTEQAASHGLGQGYASVHDIIAY